jgi:hypothetical protein
MLAMPRLIELPARTRARELVESIAKDHGYLGEDVLSQMSDDVRRQVEEALLKKDEMIGSSVMTYEVTVQATLRISKLTRDPLEQVGQESL